MFSLGTLKPLLTTLVLPPGGLLLLLFFACLLARKFQRLAWALVITSTTAAWVLSCDATAYALNHRLLTSYAPVNIHTTHKAQAIVVLGGGVDPLAPEYGGEELSNTGYKRLAYALHLAKHTGLPLLYAGGKGWSASATQTGSEAQVAALAAKRDFNMPIEWLDNESRDTRENALRAFDVLSPLGKTHILLVTNDWHMQRSLRNFEQAGFEVTPAPMGYLQPPVNLPYDYLPTANGLRHSYWVLREWLGLLMT
jgi:uncharacterized SAM-binding protein YcdF (DUF218 family)